MDKNQSEKPRTVCSQVAKSTEFTKRTTFKTSSDLTSQMDVGLIHWPLGHRYALLVLIWKQDSDCGRQNNAHDCPHPNPQNLWTLPFHGKRDLKMRFRSRTLKRGDCPGLSSAPQLTTGVRISGDPFPAVVRGRYNNGQREMTLLALGMKPGSREPRNAGASGKQENEFSPRAFRKECSSAPP